MLLKDPEGLHVQPVRYLGLKELIALSEEAGRGLETGSDPGHV